MQVTENTGKAASTYDGWDDDNIIADIRDAVAARDDAQARAENLVIPPDSSTEAQLAKAAWPYPPCSAASITSRRRLGTATP